jgi:dienelactone hydrolase
MKKTYLFILSLSMFLALFGQSYELGHTTITFNDVNRSGGFGSGPGPGRQIQTEIYYPADVAGNDVALSAGSFPVIVFGHGFAMAWSAYENIWEEFAGAGYILAFPRTEGSLLPPPSHGDFGEDLALVELAIQGLNSNNSSLFFQKVSPYSAIMGHSMGGGATFLAASNNTSSSLKAVVGLAPAETNPSAISAAFNVSVDALVLSGSSDGVTPPASNHQPIYDNLQSTCKTFLSITNGSHCYFANTNFNCDFGELTTGTGSLPRSEQQDITSDYVKLWLDFKLKSSCVAWDEFLDSLVVSTRVTEQQTCTYGYLQPAVNVSGDSLFCNGNTSLLSATPNLNYFYQWYANGDTIGGNTDTLLIIDDGQYLVVASNSLACADSSSILNVNTWPSYSTTDTANACIGSTYTFPDGFTSTTNSSHLSTLTTVNGCDSLIERTLIFGTSVSGNASLSFCAGDTFSFQGSPILSDTSFSNTLLNSSLFGCDSITSFSINFIASDTVQVFPAICYGENYQLPSGLFVNNPDTFVFNYSNQQGCDSVYIVNLTVGSPIPAFTTQFYDFSHGQGDTVFLELVENITYDSLVWSADTSVQFLYSSNDTAYFYFIEDEATYFITLSVYYNGCSRSLTSDLSIVGINELVTKSSLNVYPNPTNGFLQISSDKAIEYIQLYNLLGELIVEIITDDKKLSIDCSKLSSGVYFLKSQAGIGRFVKN